MTNDKWFSRLIHKISLEILVASLIALASLLFNLILSGMKRLMAGDGESVKKYQTPHRIHSSIYYNHLH